MSQVVHPVILCGGSGTRLWPLSTPSKPKQFLALTSDKSMIEETADRFKSSHESGISFARPLVVGSAKHEELLSKTLPQARQILEPFGRNSAPAVAAASLAYDPDDLILILSADHSIRDVPAFHQAIATAVAAANRGAIVTFGIKPTYAATGYGYIKAAGKAKLNEAIAVEEFVEKPPLSEAEAYLKSGTYFWNAGIFLFKASTMRETLKTHAKDVLSGTKKAMGKTKRDRILLDESAFEKTPSISIDFAVMEHANNVETVPVDMDWSDVGGYPALHELLTETPSENASVGPVTIRDSKGLYVRSEGPAVSVSGLTDLAIVATRDEVLVAPIDDAAAIKALGAEAQSPKNQHGLPEDLVNRAKEWLWTAFEVWSEKAWDPDLGGFVEQLTMDGEPDRTADRRVRVQARQVFSFAKAIEMGWPGADKAREIVEKGIDHIDTKLRHPEGGWVHIVQPDGIPIDDKRDLYDHAFIILAGATAYSATGNETALKFAKDAIEFIDTELKDQEHGGWFEGLPGSQPRRANPHMHLLEASCALFRATGDSADLDIARKCVSLFEKKFFDYDTDVLLEFFETDWRAAADSLPEALIEVGHMYEWATLLSQFDALASHDTFSWRRRLIKQSDSRVRLDPLQLAKNSERVDGVDVNANHRLWPQLEMLRAYLHHPGIGSVYSNASLFKMIMDRYADSEVKGSWIDELDSKGRPISTTIPASMLYHWVTALSDSI